MFHVLHEVCSAYGLAASQCEALGRLLELIRSDETAPTTVREPSTAVDVHVADSLVGLDVEALRSAGTIADLGAGAGFPGLVLAVALPSASVFLVESIGRKCAFLSRAVAAAGAENASVVCARAEEWDAQGLDAVCARAVAPLAVLVEYAAPLLRLGGVLVAWKGRRDPAEERAGSAAAEIVGLSLDDVRPVRPFPAAEARTLYVYSKVVETPTRFPRRPGIARKRPLAG